jgi:hypothetical protein
MVSDPAARWVGFSRREHCGRCVLIWAFQRRRSRSETQLQLGAGRPQSFLGFGTFSLLRYANLWGAGVCSWLRPWGRAWWRWCCVSIGHFACRGRPPTQMACPRTCMHANPSESGCLSGSPRPSRHLERGGNQAEGCLYLSHALQAAEAPVPPAALHTWAQFHL